MISVKCGAVEGEISAAHTEKYRSESAGQESAGQESAGQPVSGSDPVDLDARCHSVR